MFLVVIVSVFSYLYLRGASRGDMGGRGQGRLRSGGGMEEEELEQEVV